MDRCRLLMMAGLLLLAFPFAEGTVAAPDAPSPAASARTFTLIRVAPFSGTNPFDFRSLRADVTAARTPGGGTPPGPGGHCSVGALVLTSAMPVVPPAAAYVDVDPAGNTLRVRDSGAAMAGTALVVSLSAMDVTRVSAGPAGWQAVSPALPQDYAAGVAPQSFVVRQLASGDYYRINLGFIGTSTLAITSASGECCGTGGCP